MFEPQPQSGVGVCREPLAGVHSVPWAGRCGWTPSPASFPSAVGGMCGGTAVPSQGLSGR